MQLHPQGDPKLFFYAILLGVDEFGEVGLPGDIERGLEVLDT